MSAAADLVTRFFSSGESHLVSSADLVSGAKARVRRKPRTLPPRGPGWLATATVTWRGHLTKLLTTPYERQEGWQLAASRFQGTLYLSEVETPAARAQRLARPPLLRELMYMGYKFEQYMCAGEAPPWGPSHGRGGREPLSLLLASLLVQTSLEAPRTPPGT